MIREISTALHAATLHWQTKAAMLRDLGSDPDAIVDNLTILDEATEQAVDTALRDFSAGSPWPKLTSIEALFVYHRLSMAKSVCHLLLSWENFRKHNPPMLQWEVMDRRAVLEWLLFDCWDNFGSGSMLGTIEELCPPGSPNVGRSNTDN